LSDNIRRENSLRIRVRGLSLTPALQKTRHKIKYPLKYLQKMCFSKSGQTEKF